jgi:integrase
MINHLRRYTIGTTDKWTLADARDEAREALRGAARGNDPALNKQAERTADTFSELGEVYLEKHATNKRSGREDKRILNKYLLPKLRHMRAKDVTRAQIRSILEEIAKDAPIMANRVLASVRKMYNWAIGHDLVDQNPCFKLPAPSKERRRDRVLSVDELKKVWKALETENSDAIADAFKLRLLTAQRGGEVLGMRWDEVDVDERWWTIPSERSKNKLPHRVWLSDPVVRILERRKKEAKTSLWVFPGRREGKPIQETKRVLESLRQASGVKNWRGHDLRRTAASSMAAMGIPRFIVGRVLNHAEPGVTAVYDRHSYDAEKKDALDKWAAKLIRIVSDLKAVGKT